ncbi:mechanosensitive ion channel [Aurantiacibacter sp. D1-12]|uniref:mechanosensitive ion channel n=1 Tax=Aurantiacibacter sp. D1-12 TaxID=2993658 RepID=UPI00237CF311|nr:mechanosensitive ion channel [Aurantiacibacter sp. D1-12]MDE1467189.1 mechanosensitive ion channel [Aurantiacibacter sp. D1-12]
MSIGNYQFDPDLAMQIAEKVGVALLILVITWLLAKAAKWAAAKVVDAVPLLQRETGSGQSVGLSIGKIVSLLIWLFGLLGILQVLGLNAVAGPIDELLNNIMGFVPNLIGAGILAYVGFMIASIVRDLVTTTAQTLNVDRFANMASNGNVEEVTGSTAISKTLGTIAYIFIAIPVAIGALGVLNIAAISGPATDMLDMILAAIPRIIAAAVLLGLGYVISKFIVGLLTELLEGFGVDRTIAATGLTGDDTKASAIIARVVQIAILLFFAIAATRLLGFPELTGILNEVLALGGSVVFAAVVIGAGFLIANVLGKLIDGTAGTIVRWATIIIFTFMGLSYTGVGEMIPETAFSALVIGIAVAGALAFGLGGREWAARKLEEWDRK